MTPALPKILDRLESHYGPQQPAFPTDPYQFLLWWHCGYPASDANCAKGWHSLNTELGTAPESLLSAAPKQLAAALQPGGMVPELRALRLKEVAARAQRECASNLRAHLAAVPLTQARKLLVKFPGIAGPGADRILRFAGIAPLPAVPSNCTQVLPRIQRVAAIINYNAAYRTSSEWIASELPETVEARTRAYLLIKRHGQELCKRTNPKCDLCPVRPNCRFGGER
jgi:endonuclease III